jgi:hypothetical protein
LNNRYQSLVQGLRSRQLRLELVRHRRVGMKAASNSGGLAA